MAEATVSITAPTLKLWSELKIENLVDSTIVQKTNRRALKFYIDYGVK